MEMSQAACSILPMRLITAFVLGLLVCSGLPARAADVVAYGSSGWRYRQVPRNDPLAGSFHAAGFDDSNWATGVAAFGQGTTGCPLDPTIHTAWAPNTEVLLRRVFRVDPSDPEAPVTLYLAIDNDAQVWVNGVLVMSATHSECPALDEFKAQVPDGIITAGDNVLAVRAIDNGVASFIDLRVDVVPPHTRRICAQVNEGGTATLTAPEGYAITSIDFASFGTPESTCGSFTYGSCNAASSRSVVEAACLGQPGCSVSANTASFGDPCYGTVKRLRVQATCTPHPEAITGSVMGATPPAGARESLGDLDVTASSCAGRFHDATRTLPDGSFSLATPLCAGDRVVSFLGNDEYKVRDYASRPLGPECESQGSLCQGMERLPTGQTHELAWSGSEPVYALYWARKMDDEFWSGSLERPHLRLMLLEVNNSTKNVTNKHATAGPYTDGSGGAMICLMPGIAGDQETVYHEFGHAMVIQLLEGRLISEGDRSEYTEWMAMDEGFADYFTAAATGDVWIGDQIPASYGFKKRTVASPKARRQYCNGAYDAENAYTSCETFSGALWSLRNLLQNPPYDVEPGAIDAWMYDAIADLGRVPPGGRTFDAYRGILRDKTIPGHGQYSGEVDAAFAERNVKSEPEETCNAAVKVLYVAGEVLVDGVMMSVRWTKNAAASSYTLLKRAFGGGGMGGGIVVAEGITDTSYVYVEADTSLTYAYVVIPVDSAGYDLPASVETPAVTTVEGVRTAVSRLEVGIYPNPTRGTVGLRIWMAGVGRGTVEIFDVAGRRVRRLWSGEGGAAALELQWDGRDEGGRGAGAGVFLVRVSRGSVTRTTRVVRLE